MSIRVKNRLDRLQIVTTHEDRVEVDKEIERRTALHCDKGISYYKRPVQTPPPAEPLLVDLALCVDRCWDCGKPIDKYPRHTHREYDSGYAVRYECICHKCVPVPFRRGGS